MMDIEALSLFGIKDERVSSVLSKIAMAILEGRARESLTKVFGINTDYIGDIPGVIELRKGVYFHSGNNLKETIGLEGNFPVILAVGGRIRAEELVHELLNGETYRRAFGIKGNEKVDSLNFLGIWGERFYSV